MFIPKFCMGVPGFWMKRTGRRTKLESHQNPSDPRLDVGKSWLQLQQRSACQPSSLLLLERPSALTSQKPQQLPVLEMMIRNYGSLNHVHGLRKSSSCLPVAVGVAVVHLGPWVEPFRNLIILQLQAAFHCRENNKDCKMSFSTWSLVLCNDAFEFLLKF